MKHETPTHLDIKNNMLYRGEFPSHKVDFDMSNELMYVVDEGDCTLSYARDGDAGLDLPVVLNPSDPDKIPKISPHRDYYFSLKDKQPWIDIPAGGTAHIYTGIRVKVPDNAWGSIKGRSSTSWKKGLVVHEGVIDSGYVGPLFLLVANPKSEPVRVSDGDRLAQLIIIPKHHFDYIIRTDKLPETDRGSKGFGSTGGVTY